MKGYMGERGCWHPRAQESGRLSWIERMQCSKCGVPLEFFGALSSVRGMRVVGFRRWWILKEAVEQRCLSLVQGKNGFGLWAAGCLWKMAEFLVDVIIDYELFKQRKTVNLLLVGLVAGIVDVRLDRRSEMQRGHMRWSSI